MSIVPNLFPSHPPGETRLAFVGEAPGAEELLVGQPFVGSAGRLLTKVLLSVGLTRAELFIGNVCQTRPPGNDLSSFAWEGEEIQGGIESLIKDLSLFQPNLIIALGNVPLHLFMAGNVPPKHSKGGFVFPFKISQWRGSLFLSTPLSAAGLCATQLVSERLPIDKAELAAVTFSPQPVQSGSSPALLAMESNRPPEPDDSSGLSSSPTGCGVSLTSVEGVEGDVAPPSPPHLPPTKVLPTWHPAGVLRELSKAFDLRQDLRKAVEAGKSPLLSLPPLNLRYGP